MQKLGTKKIETATFTIQNVPIKLKYENGILIEVGDLQYRMFLLNKSYFLAYLT